MSPLISIIIPIYNGEKYLDNLISNLYHHNMDIVDDLEIVLIDDGSTDNSYIKIRELQEKYECVSAFHKENGGIASARNEGIKNCHGEFVAFCDQDDSLTKGYSTFIKKIVENKCDFLISNGSGKFKLDELCCGEQVNTYARYMLAYGLVPYLGLPKNPLSDISQVWNCIFKKSFILENKIRFESFVDYEDDWKFVTHSLVCANRVYFDTDSFYKWTVNPQSESHTHKYILNYIDKRQKHIEWICEKLKDCGVDKITILKYRESPEICRSVVVDAFYNACNCDYRSYLGEMRELEVRGWNVKKETIQKARTKPQIFFLTLLYLRMFKIAFTLNKYFLKRTYH